MSCMQVHVQQHGEPKQTLKKPQQLQLPRMKV